MTMDTLFNINCTFTSEHDTSKTFAQQLDAVCSHLHDNGWRLVDSSENYEDGDGAVCADLCFDLHTEQKIWKGKEITGFLVAAGEVCGDSLRVHGGGSTYTKKAKKVKA